MLIFSAQTMQVLGERGRSSFEAELALHAKGYAPELCRIVGDVALRQAVSSWVDRASAHGFTLRGPTRLFAELALTFGSSFDSDPQLPWAGQILADVATDEMDRARGLFAAGHEFLAETAGPDDQYSWAALRGVRDMVGMSPLHQGDALAARILVAIRDIHPNKAHVVGEAALLDLVEGARVTCERFHLAGDAPVLLLAGLMFGFGHGVAHDPLYPWVARTLARTPGPGSDERARQLARKVMIYVDHMLTRLAPRQAGRTAEDVLAEFGEPND